MHMRMPEVITVQWLREPYQEGVDYLLTLGLLKARTMVFQASITKVLKHETTLPGLLRYPNPQILIITWVPCFAREGSATVYSCLWRLNLKTRVTANSISYVSINDHHCLLQLAELAVANKSSAPARGGCYDKWYIFSRTKEFEAYQRSIGWYWNLASEAI